MTKTTTIINGVLFYVSLFVFAIFLSGGCETIIWYIPTVCCGLMMWKFSKMYAESEWRVFTGINFVQRIIGIDLLAKE